MLASPSQPGPVLRSRCQSGVRSDFAPSYTVTLVGPHKSIKRLFPASGAIASPSNRKPERKTAGLLRTHLLSMADSK